MRDGHLDTLLAADCSFSHRQVVDSFDDMKLREDLLRGIYAYGFEKPSAIQQRAIVPCIQGHDVIAQCVCKRRLGCPWW